MYRYSKLPAAPTRGAIPRIGATGVLFGIDIKYGTSLMSLEKCHLLFFLVLVVYSENNGKTKIKIGVIPGEIGFFVARIMLALAYN